MEPIDGFSYLIDAMMWLFELFGLLVVAIPVLVAVWISTETRL